MMRTIRKYWAIILIVIVYSILLCVYFSKFSYGLSNLNEKWGTFGDFFGGSLSPIIGIISIVLTYNIINNQNVEYKQNEFKFIFEVLFSAITDKLSIIERTVKVQKSKEILYGVKALEKINQDILSVYTFKKRKNKNGDFLTLFRDSFWSVNKDVKGCWSPYMKNIHNCLKAIDKNCVEERKEQYSSLLRAQLHNNELIFIFFNGLASEKHKNFMKRVEHYSILKDVADFNFPIELKNMYKDIAFKELIDKPKKLNLYTKYFSFEFSFIFRRV